MKYKDVVVQNSQPKQTIYTYLKLQQFSENFLRNLRKKEGYILLNGKVVFINVFVKDGDVISICTSPNTKSNICKCIIPLDIVFEDEDLLVINKPANLATMPSRSHYSNNLSGAILNYMQDDFVVRIITRLDKDASGLVVCAKNALVAKALSQPNYIKKTYYALCNGTIKNSIEIHSPIADVFDENGINLQKRIIAEDGKSASTYVYPQKVSKDISLVSVNIVHGRTHQIRVHLSSQNFALLGDKIYGKECDLIARTALHCKAMSFVHPTTNQIICVETSFPADFKDVINYMDK